MHEKKQTYLPVQKHNLPLWVCGSSHVKASPVVKTNTPLSALPEQTNKQCLTHVMHRTIDLDLITGVLLGQSRLLL